MQDMRHYITYHTTNSLNSIGNNLQKEDYCNSKPTAGKQIGYWLLPVIHLMFLIYSSQFVCIYSASCT